MNQCRKEVFVVIGVAQDSETTPNTGVTERGGTPLVDSTDAEDHRWGAGRKACGLHD